MSTPTQRRTDGNNPANNAGGFSAPRNQAAISSAAQAARTSWQQRTKASQSGSTVQPASAPQSSSGRSKRTQATTTSQTGSTPTALRRDETAASQPIISGSGSSGSQSQNARVEELEARLAMATIRVINPDGSVTVHNGDPTRENPLRLRLRETHPTGECEVEIDLRSLAAPAPSVAVGTSQRVEAAPATAAQDPPKCTICWEPFTTRATLMPCGHEFDLGCILPWFQSIIQDNRWGVILTCPLCRQRATLIRHAYTSSGDFETLDIIMHFLRTGRTGSGAQSMSSPTAVPRPRPHGVGSGHDPNTANLPTERYRGRNQDLILRGPAEDHLDLEHINTMGPHQLEVFVMFLRGRPEQIARLNRKHLLVLNQRRARFMELLGDAASSARDLERRSQIVFSFPGFTRQDSLDWDAIYRMNREELDRFRTLIVRDLSVWMSFEDVQRLYQRCHELENPRQRRERQRNDPAQNAQPQVRPRPGPQGHPGAPYQGVRSQYWSPPQPSSDS